MFIALPIIMAVALTWVILDMEKTNRKNKVLVNECNRILDRMVVKIRKMKETIKEINILREFLVKDYEYLEKTK